jgi:purine-binding chemotaxis protein CheW
MEENINNHQIHANHENITEGKREKYLIFSLMDEFYGFSLSTVKEVIGLTDITPIPNVPSHFKGLINLRGRIISVIDLRVKLNLAKAEYQDKKTCIIIVELAELVLGVIVDDVSAVAAFMTSQIERGLDLSSKVSREFLTGVAKTEDKRLILLLDTAKVLNVEEMKMIKDQITNNGNGQTQKTKVA